MKKLISLIKKHDNIFVIILILFSILGMTYNVYFMNSDESYNFLNTYKMAEGLMIYKDSNVIITPLFFYVAEIFLRIFGENIFVFRTLNLIISIIVIALAQ